VKEKRNKNNKEKNGVSHFGVDCFGHLGFAVACICWNVGGVFAKDS
jgi:hypothetical protein